MQFCRIVLCRVGIDDSDCRQCLHLFLCDARRDFCLDHCWDLILEYVSAMSRWRLVLRLCESATAVFGLNLPDKWASPVWASAVDGVLLQSPGFPHRLHSDAAAGARREGIGEDEQHHGGDQDRRHPDLPGGRRNAGEARELDAVCAFRL